MRPHLQIDFDGSELIPPSPEDIAAGVLFGMHKGEDLLISGVIHGVDDLRKVDMEVSLRPHEAWPLDMGHLYVFRGANDTEYEGPLKLHSEEHNLFRMEVRKPVEAYEDRPGLLFTVQLCFPDGRKLVVKAGMVRLHTPASY